MRMLTPCEGEEIDLVWGWALMIIDLLECLIVKSVLFLCLQTLVKFSTDILTLLCIFSTSSIIFYGS